MKTIVAYHLHNEDFTATLIRKAGLFWFVEDAEGQEIRIPAKAVEETWEEMDEPTTDAERDELIVDQETPEPLADEPDDEPNHEPDAYLPVPSLADQLAAGPTLEAPGDTITLAEMADTYGFVGRIARRKLRKAWAAGIINMSWMASPDRDFGGDWTFQRTAIDSVMKIITSTQRG
jgi:hypothetical protein